MQKWKELIETKTPESLNFLDVTGFCTTTKLKQRRWSYDSYGMTDIKRKRTRDKSSPPHDLLSKVSLDSISTN